MIYWGRLITMYKGGDGMKKNVPNTEKLIRIVLGVIFGLLACLTGSWPGWVRIVFGIIGIAFLGTAFVGY